MYRLKPIRFGRLPRGCCLVWNWIPVLHQRRLVQWRWCRRRSRRLPWRQGRPRLLCSRRRCGDFSDAPKKIMITRSDPSALFVVPNEAVIADALHLDQFVKMIDVADVLFTPFGVDVTQ